MFPESTQSNPNGTTLQQSLSTAELNALVLERVRKMTPEEKFKSLIASGIYTPAGELTREYAPLAVPAYGE